MQFGGEQLDGHPANAWIWVPNEWGTVEVWIDIWFSIKTLVVYELNVVMCDRYLFVVVNTMVLSLNSIVKAYISRIYINWKQLLTSSVWICDTWQLSNQSNRLCSFSELVGVIENQSHHWLCKTYLFIAAQAVFSCWAWLGKDLGNHYLLTTHILSQCTLTWVLPWKPVVASSNHVPWEVVSGVLVNNCHPHNEHQGRKICLN